MNAPVVHIGPQTPEQVGYDLAWQARLGRADDWRRTAGLTPRLAEALAAEERHTGRWVGYDEEVTPR